MITTLNAILRDNAAWQLDPPELKLNAVARCIQGGRHALRIARQFGLSQSDVRKALGDR